MKKIISHTTQTLRRIPGIDWIVLGLGLVVFVLLTVATITKSTIWFDEAFTAYIVQFNYFDIVRYTATDVHPPFYYWLAKLWTDFFGTTELAFRSLSVVFGMSTIAFGFLLVKRLFGRRAAWLTLLLLVLSPMLIRYSQEARMYTLAATIALSATHVLTFAVESKRRLPWVVYGILISIGMWTHYFTAVVWLAHWAWRLVVTRQLGLRGKQLLSTFFSKNWIIAHVVAIGLFLPWIPFMVTQLTTIQSTGFWIGNISADSLTNYMTNVLFYLEHDQARGWYALALGIIVSTLLALGIKFYVDASAQQRKNYLLLISLAFVPVLLLFIVSLPPLRSSFVERYLVPSAAGFSLFAGVTLALGATKLKAVWRMLAIGVLVASLLFGVSNVYYFGNYNKNTNMKVRTGDIVKQINDIAQPGQPIIAQSPWIFYEAIFYTTDEHPVYFIDANTDYIYGSLDMLKLNDQHKIKDLQAFVQEHPVVWYVGSTSGEKLTSPDANWRAIQSVSSYDVINQQSPYKAVQYQTR